MMFREMRRQKQVLSQEDSIAVLMRGTSGVLAVAGDEDYPYAVPLSYVYDHHKLYFHCAQSGHKLDSIARNNKSSFCVIDKDEIVSEKYTTFFRSVIAFGKVRILTDEKEKMAAAQVFAAKYTPEPEYQEGLQKELVTAFNRLTMLELSIEHLSGKEAIELVQKK